MAAADASEKKGGTIVGFLKGLAVAYLCPVLKSLEIFSLNRWTKPIGDAAKKINNNGIVVAVAAVAAIGQMALMAATGGAAAAPMMSLWGAASGSVLTNGLPAIGNLLVLNFAGVGENLAKLASAHSQLLGGHIGINIIRGMQEFIPKLVGAFSQMGQILLQGIDSGLRAGSTVSSAVGTVIPTAFAPAIIPSLEVTTQVAQSPDITTHAVDSFWSIFNQGRAAEQQLAAHMISNGGLQV